MPDKNIIRVSEFEKLYYDNNKPFKQKHWEALCRYLEGVNIKLEKRLEYFRILNKGVQFTNFVGVIQAGNLTIEILPKVDKGFSTAANQRVQELEEDDPQTAQSKSALHKVLLDMLRECRFLRVNHVDYANLNLRSNSILDIYLELFLVEAERLIHEGLLKKYQKKEGNQTALKGQLLFPKHIAYNSTHQERVYVRYTEYNRDNIYNRILYKTLRFIPLISNSTHLIDRAGRLLLDFPELSNGNITAESFSRLQFDRKTERYRDALLISKMLLLNYRPDITGGSENVIAILFDMNKLWEEFVYRRLKKEEQEYNITVLRQQSEDFWNSEYLSRPKTIRPDIVIEKRERTIVVDTKWKMMEEMVPADDDLKQMFVYNLFWNCQESILLYPAMEPDESTGDYADFLKLKDSHSQCTVMTISVLDLEQKLNSKLGQSILDTIFKTK